MASSLLRSGARVPPLGIQAHVDGPHMRNAWAGPHRPLRALQSLHRLRLMVCWRTQPPRLAKAPAGTATFATSCARTRRTSSMSDGTQPVVALWQRCGSPPVTPHAVPGVPHAGTARLDGERTGVTGLLRRWKRSSGKLSETTRRAHRWQAARLAEARCLGSVWRPAARDFLAVATGRGVKTTFRTDARDRG